MTDVLTPTQRRFNMSRIRNKNTRPEIIVRSLLHKNGFRYRLHVKELPGKPDLVFPKYKVALFINGCFWHMHDCKYGNVVPASNFDFWKNKREKNLQHDKKVYEELKVMGWKVRIIWECQIKDKQNISSTLFSLFAD